MDEREFIQRYLLACASNPSCPDDEQYEAIRIKVARRIYGRIEGELAKEEQPWQPQ